MTHSEDEVRGNILGIFFTILSGVMIALIVLAYGRSDKMAPEFRFSALDLVYDSATNDKDLIVGINAYDAKDGDITDRIVVEKVVLNKDAETAVVYYAVADHSGNVTKQSRVFPANIMVSITVSITVSMEKEKRCRLPVPRRRKQWQSLTMTIWMS